MRGSKIAITANSSWYIYNFRKNTILSLLQSGADVWVLAPDDVYFSKLTSLGCRCRMIYINLRSKNPFIEAFSVFSYFNKLKILRPNVLLSFTPKAVLYGGLSSKLLGIRFVNNISGLGSLYVNGGVVSGLVSKLYGLVIRMSFHTFFQNEEDFKYLTEGCGLGGFKFSVIPGSGVDLAGFRYSDLPTSDNRKLKFLFVGRLLRSKGLEIFFLAAREVKRRFPDVQFDILGFLNEDHPDGVSKKELDEWVSEGWVNYIGCSDQVSKVINAYDCVVLPSYYREGVPRSLLEAGALGRPVITTDSAGCRDTVIDGASGFLVEPRNERSLARAMLQFLSLSYDDRREMGLRARKLVEEKFDEKRVIGEYKEIILRALSTE